MNNIEDSTSPDDVNIYHYWKIFRKYKWIFWGVFLGALVIAAIVNMNMKKIYQFEVSVKMATPDFKPAIENIAYYTENRSRKIFFKTLNYISNWTASLDSATQTSRLTFEISDTNYVPLIKTELLHYMVNFASYKSSIDQKKILLEEEIAEVSKAITRTENLLKSFSDEDVRKHYSGLTNTLIDLEIRKKHAEGALNSLTTEVTYSYVTPKAVKPDISKNITITGIIGFFAGIFLVFSADAVKRFRTPPSAKQ